MIIVSDTVDYYDQYVSRFDNALFYRRDHLKTSDLKDITIEDPNLPSLRRLTHLSHDIGIPFMYQWMSVCGFRYLVYQAPKKKFHVSEPQVMMPEMLSMILRKIKNKYPHYQYSVEDFVGAIYPSMNVIDHAVQNPIYMMGLLQQGELSPIYKPNPVRFTVPHLKSLFFDRVMDPIVLAGTLMDYMSHYPDWYKGCTRYTEMQNSEDCHGCKWQSANDVCKHRRVKRMS